jgi:protein-S-isoprenylcysteine O-methyltransferase Ste14
MKQFLNHGRSSVKRLPTVLGTQDGPGIRRVFAASTRTVYAGQPHPSITLHPSCPKTGAVLESRLASRSLDTNTTMVIHERPDTDSPFYKGFVITSWAAVRRGGTLIRAIALTVALFLLPGGCLFGAAGQLSWPMAWAVLGVYSVFKAAAFAFVDPELIRERAAPGPGVDRGDMVLATLGYLGLYPSTFVAAGLDAVRFGPAIPIPQSAQVTALLVFALGYGFAFWAVCSNPFFATFVRIQDDRDHSVVSSGAYALVRHPGYAGGLLAHLALPFALGSIWA